MIAIIMKNDAKRKPRQKIDGASLFNNPVKLLEDSLNFQSITRIEQIVI